MPEYLSPGVYIEEIELGARPIEGVSTSTAGFLGLTERGPTDVQLVTGFTQFQRLYGGFVKEFYLPYAIDGFFRNGGQRCFIGRIVRSGAKAAELVTGAITITTTFEAVGAGDWGNRVAIRIDDASLAEPPTSPPAPAKFKLTVAYWSKSFPTSFAVPLGSPVQDPKRLLRQLLETATQPVEVFDNLSTDPDSPDFYEKKINGTSNLIKVKVPPDTAGRPENTAADVFMESLTSVMGSDGDGNRPDPNDFLRATPSICLGSGAA